MKIEPINFKSTTWGVVDHPKHPGHFFTGYSGSWERYSSTIPGRPSEKMQIGKNVIIRGDFRLEGQFRGMSAANYKGHFRGHADVDYLMSMDGMLQIVKMLQAGIFTICDGYVSGTWTIAKKGSNIFLHPTAP